MSDRLTYSEAAPEIASRNRHERFYIPDGNVVFLVEGTLFKVHRYFFIHGSNVFQGMFSMPSPAGEDSEGMSDERPIFLEGISSLDFARFLTMFYPRSMLKPDLETTLEWNSVLELAVKWQFDDIQALVVARLTEHASSVDQILLARQYRLSDWFYDAHVKICSRYEPLTLEEGRRLGVDEVVIISDVRQYNIRFNRGNVDHDKLRGALRVLEQL
ncbi:hypothetical protein IEO21_03869 [Rhodonia placenta]|uniref:BTB domain-containing protein n=1 Tax=Rhodonia placenta TaxID=104341 RepID=A0A8H7P4W4_9APHY|nr:hypothetical protein IEO21_03869 [Postia placenta]